MTINRPSNYGTAVGNSRATATGLPAQTASWSVAYEELEVKK